MVQNSGIVGPNNEVHSNTFQSTITRHESVLFIEVAKPSDSP